MKSLLGAVSGATIRLTQQKKEEAAREAQKQLEESTPRRTFSLFGFGGDDADTSPAPAPTPPAPKNAAPKPMAAPKKPTKTAPRGVPTLSKWRKNRDGSVSGLISGSSNFSNGERVTTSPIASGALASGEIVKTGSGSRYFLE